MNPAKLAMTQIQDLVLTCLGTLVSEEKIPSVPLPAYSVEVPADPSHGDFSCNVALVSAKALKQNPRNIANLIAETIYLKDSAFDRVEVAGPGFLNFFLNPTWFSNTVDTVLKLKHEYGKTDLGAGKRVLVEFVSANPTGPMHIGNARGGALGDCLSSLLEFAGYYVEREFYVNDAGNQVNKLGLSLDIRYQQALGVDIEMPEDSYHGQDIIDHSNNFIKEYGDSYLNVSEQERRDALTSYALPLNIQKLKDDLAAYRIQYNTWFKESELHKNGAVDEIIELLKSKGHTYEKDGALWFKASQFGDEQDRVIVRGNGIPTYIVPDIAYHYNKLITRGFDIAIDILGADHHGYVPRMRAALTALGVDASKLQVIIMQMVRLVRNGETVKLSKRSGKAITLSTLLEEVPIDAARFFFNLRDANTHLDFDLDLAVEESSKNPVYYVQYAHARICSLFSRLALEGIVPTFPDVSNLVYNHPAELDLIRKLAILPETINDAASDFNPSKITKYIYELAQLYHKFYDSCRIKGEEETVLQSRLSLCKACGIVLRNLLDLLKIEAPEKM